MTCHLRLQKLYDGEELGPKTGPPPPGSPGKISPAAEEGKGAAWAGPPRSPPLGYSVQNGHEDTDGPKKKLNMYEYRQKKGFVTSRASIQGTLIKIMLCITII